jgi:uncharacterized membrane protein YtjA (UPF0391 family)
LRACFVLARLLPDRYSNNAITAKESVMLHYAVVFFVIALIAALLGFTGIAAGAADIARILFFLFIVIFLVSIVLGFLRGW